MACYVEGGVLSMWSVPCRAAVLLSLADTVKQQKYATTTYPTTCNPKSHCLLPRSSVFCEEAQRLGLAGVSASFRHCSPCWSRCLCFARCRSMFKMQ